jgi:hypothetical protein
MESKNILTNSVSTIDSNIMQDFDFNAQRDMSEKFKMPETLKESFVNSL